MSLKAGGVGINLTAASNAFVLVSIEDLTSCFLIVKWRLTCMQ
jgi:hypothetical protein